MTKKTISEDETLLIKKLIKISNIMTRIQGSDYAKPAIKRSLDELSKLREQLATTFAESFNQQ